MLYSFLIQLLSILTLSFYYVTAYNKPPCDYYQSVNITGANILENGSAIFDGKEYRNGSYGYFNNSFFGDVADADRNKTHLRGCFCHLPGKPCVPVCCPVGFLKRDSYDKTCYPYKFVLRANTSNFENNYTTFIVEDKYRLVQRDPCQYHQYHLHEKWELLENGSLHSNELNEDEYNSYGPFCLDPILTDNSEIETSLLMCYKRNNRVRTYIDFDEIYGSYKRPSTHLYEILGMISSIVALGITFAIYYLVPHLQDLRGKIMMSYMASIIVFYTFVAIDKAEILDTSTIPCTLVGFISYGSALMAIFFLNAISCDYFTAFYMKDFRTANKSKLFRWYSLYSTGGTLFFVFLAAILDASEVAPKELLPSIGSESCFLHSDRVSKFYFFYMIIAITLFLNTLLLIVTGCKMRRIMKTRTMGKEDRRNYNDRKERETFCHILLLFLFVDFSWITEACFWSIDIYRRGHDPVLYFFQFFGYSQGIWIFLICILRGKTFELIGKRWKDFRSQTDNSEGGVIKYLRADSNISEVQPPGV